MLVEETPVHLDAKDGDEASSVLYSALVALTCALFVATALMDPGHSIISDSIPI